MSIDIPTPQALRLLRTDVMNLTREQFAKKLGVSVSLIISWEVGRRKPSTPVMKLIDLMCAEILEVE